MLTLEHREALSRLASNLKDGWNTTRRDYAARIEQLLLAPDEQIPRAMCAFDADDFAMLLALEPRFRWAIERLRFLRPDDMPTAVPAPPATRHPTADRAELGW
jgi:hypothetical protein